MVHPFWLDRAQFNPNSEIWNRPRPRRRARPRCIGIPEPQRDRCPATILFS
jgi:hypothetical protein